MAVTLPAAQPPCSARLAGVDEHRGHAWPSLAGDWDEIIACDACGLRMLRLFFDSPSWVVRRVETVTFLDDRTVRRRMSVDYSTPADAVILRHGRAARPVRILPLTVMRRKSLINFDLRDEDDRPMPLLGLRETQGLTLSVAGAWAAAALAAKPSSNGASTRLPREVRRFIKDAVAGDQAAMNDAYDDLTHAETGPLATLRHDQQFRVVLDRLADSFIVFTTDEKHVGTRRIVKFAYDEPLTLRYSTTTYQGHSDGPVPPRPAEGDPDPVTYGKGKAGRRMSGWERAPRRAGLGLEPTLIRFPVPAAELAAAYHFEISAPPEVSIVEASLLAGLPNLFFHRKPARDRDAWPSRYARTNPDGLGPRGPLRRRPPFDHISAGGYPTVDLHVVDVPFGSLSRAQVRLQASFTGWLTTAVASTWLATATLLVAWRAHNPDKSVATTVLITFAAAIVALLARTDPHRMVTRLVSHVRSCAGLSAVLTLAGAVAFAFASEKVADRCLLGFAALSAVPTVLVTWSWWRSRRRLSRERVPAVEPGLRMPLLRRLRRNQALELDRLSPWEQHLPDQAPNSGADADFHVKLAKALDAADYPYDEAVKRLGFGEPAVKVASSEGVRPKFPWRREFYDEVQRRLDRPPVHDTGRVGRT